MNARETVRQFFGDVFRGCSGDVVLVSALRPFACRVVDSNAPLAASIDFDRELFFAVATYEPGSVAKTGKGRNKENLSAVGVIHFDFDKKKFDDAEAHFKSKGLPSPSYVFQRVDRFHVYYLLSEPCTDFAAYEKTIKALAKRVGADVLPAQPAALMRVPYTAHKKGGKTGPGYKLVSAGRKRYNLADLTPGAVAANEPEKPEAPKGGAGFASLLLKERAKIESGGGRSSALYQFALRCRDFAIEEKEAHGLVREFNERFCVPPETPEVVKHQVTSAYKYAKHAPGRYLSEKPENMARKFDADCKIAEALNSYVYVAEAEILLNTETGLRYSKAAQIENAICYATGTKTSLQYVLTFRLIDQKDKLAFRPDEEAHFQKDGISFYNTFEPFEERPKAKPRKSDVKIFEEHLKYLTNTEEEFVHLRKFLAGALLAPGQKIKHALLLISVHEGIGKSVLQLLASKILQSQRGTPYVISTSNTEIARGNNSWIESKFLTFVHELGQSDKFAVLDQLKNWITEPRVRISDKYVRSYEIENFCNFVFFSNAVNALPISAHDRRFFIVINRKKPQPTAYYTALLDAFENGVHSIMAYLEPFVKDLDINAPPPVTESKLELRGYSKNELVLFLDEVLHDPGMKDFFASGFTIRALAERVQDSASASNVRFSQKQAAIWLRENNFFMRETHENGRHVRQYVRDNVLRKADKFTKGKKHG